MAWKARGSLSFYFDHRIVPIPPEAVPVSLHDRAAHVQKDKKAPFGAFFNVAEREGFEPSTRQNRVPDFESGAIDHSTTSPYSVETKPRL